MKSPAILLSSLFLALTLPMVARAAPRAEHVFIISFDQGNPDLIMRTEMPTFHAMVETGAHAEKAYTIVPSLTLPSHTSMLTGVGIQAHQIQWNDYRPEKGPVTVPTIFSLADERGLATAMYVGKEKFKQLVLPGSPDLFVRPRPEDNALAVARVFAEQFEESRPNLCFIHFRDPDTLGHAHGAESPEKIRALKDSDAALRIIREAVDKAGLLEESVFILTADHGSHDTKNARGETVGTHGSADPEDVLIPWVVWGKGVKPGFRITSPVLQYDTAATALWLLDVPLPESFWGDPVTKAFHPDPDV